MLKRLRRANLSLATKCQLLFGTAAGVIILVALVVAWQRIEQLTAQQDLAAAEVLAKQRLAAHAQDGDVRAGEGTEAFDGATVRPPHLVGADGPADWSPFEAEAFEAFADRPERRTFWRDVELPAADETDDPRPGVRLALAARATADCLACHAATGDSLGQWATTRPADDSTPPLLGLVSVEVPTQVGPRQRLLNRGFLVTAAVVASATATLTLYLILTRLILGPVRVLQDAAERVRGGDLNVRAEIRSGDEFETLARTFNGTVATLAARNDDLARANRSLDQRLGDLAQANVALDESNRLKGEFLANVSHELRTPLNSILGFADLVRDTAGENAKAARYATNIKKSGGALLDLINDLLDLAKIEAGRMEVRRAKFSVGDVFEALATLVAPLASKAGVRVVTRVGPDVPIVESDAGKLQQILFNLLSNAIKFSPPGGRVDVVARVRPDHPGWLRIAVSDQGPGIDARDQRRIFEKFRQLDAGVTREHPGTGLGLAISRELAGLLGGELGVDSTPGEGATFWLHLPVSSPT